MAGKRPAIEPKETLKVRKERALRAIQSDDFLDVATKKVGTKGSVYVGREYEGQDAIVVILKGRGEE